MKRHELWRYRYRAARDLDHLTPEELSERMHDCINNIRTRTEAGKLGLLSVREAPGQQWIILYTQALEECQLRGYPYPGPISIAPYRSALDHAFDPIPDTTGALAKLRATEGPYLLKFGESKWLRRSLELGAFRIASASYYDSAAHNHARRDEELQRRTRLNPRNPLCVPGTEAMTYPTDYFLFSLSASYSARLFGDFACASCLVIHDPVAFLKRMLQGVSAQWPGWRIESTRVTYYDPVRVDPAAIDVPKFKSFRHTYQDEVRIIGIPPDPIGALSPFEVELGSLTDCATLVELQ
jgi:hypothetical protein